MATPLSAAALIATLKKWKVNYKEYPGWATRTRPGTITPIGFIQHHTGGAFTHSMSYLEFLFVTGRPSEGIPGPLCNFAITDDGVCWVGSRLRTNNAGAGDWQTREKVGAESYAGYSSEIKPGTDDYNAGNQYYWGVEICYPGTVPMRAAQYATAVRLGAAIVDAYGWTALSTLAHREHSYRKWDPGNMSLSKFRNDVKALLLAGPEGGGTNVAFDTTEVGQIKQAIRDVLTQEKLIQSMWYSDHTYSFATALSSDHFYSVSGAAPALTDKPYNPNYANNPTLAGKTYAEVVAIKAQVAALAEVVAALSNDPNLDLEAVKTIVQDATRAALEDAVVEVDVNVTQPAPPV